MPGIRRYKNNTHFFDRPTIQNCYWAGFIAGDGCIENNNYGTSKLLSLNLSKKDRSHIIKFKQAISSNSPISKCGAFIRIRVCDARYCSKLLQNWNIGVSKTWTLKPPKLVRLSHKLSYLIGLFDADGSWYYHSTRGYYVWQICGTRKILKWVKKILEQKLQCKLPKIIRHSSIYELRVQGNKAMAIKTLLVKVKLGNTKLRRKWLT